MPLIYSAVARGTAILCEWSVFAGNFSAISKDYLSKTSHASNANARFAHTVDNHVFSFLAEDGYCEFRGRWAPAVVAAAGGGGRSEGSVGGRSVCRRRLQGAHIGEHSEDKQHHTTALLSKCAPKRTR